MKTTTAIGDSGIAQTILAQLGGSCFVAMTGARNFIAIERGLTLKLGRGAHNGITHVTITLDASDTYTVRFQRVHGAKVTEKGTYEGIYVDMLRGTFTQATGFVTSLGR